MAFGITAGAWLTAAATVGGAAIAYKGSKDASKSAEAQNQAQIDANAKLPQNDPRIAQMLYGNGTQQLKPGTAPSWGAPDANGMQVSTNPQSDYTTNNGLLGHYQDLLNKPQSAAMQQAGQTAGNYLTQNGSNDMNAMRDTAIRQTMGIQAPQIGNAPQMGAPIINNVPLVGQSQIQLPTTEAGSGAYMRRPSDVQGVAVSGPAQNGMDLTSYFNSTINAPPGSNPYLTDKINGDMAQSKNYFDQMQYDSTKNLREMILPSIRGGAIASGQYGGSRQGIAEGRAIGDQQTEQQRAITQYGQNNTNAAVSARSAAYETDSNRALSAAQALSEQQNAAAIASANNQQSANMANMQSQLTTYQTNAQLQQQRDLQSQSIGSGAAITQAQLNQAGNLANQSAILGVGQNNQQSMLGTNGQNMQSLLGTNSGNLQSQLQTNQLNSGNVQAGQATLGGLLGNAYSQAGTQDQYGMNQAIQGNSLLAPYLSKNGTATQLQPVYNNSGSAALGGAIAGASLGKTVAGYFGGSGAGNPNTLTGYANGYNTGQSASGGGSFYDGYGWGT